MHMDAYLGTTGADPVPDGNNDEKFPHPSKGAKRMCKECVAGVSGPGYKKSKQKLGSLLTQCQRCSNACCKEHYVLLCKGCGDKVEFATAEVPPPRREVT